MKKMPTLFKRVFDGNHIVQTYNELTDPSLEDVLIHGVPTVKFDGACCAFIDGVFYKRYDAKITPSGMRKTPPDGAIPCCDPDPVTGHWPHWVAVSKDNSADKWFLSALDTLFQSDPDIVPDGTYEAIGPHFNGNPYRLSVDCLIKHGSVICPDFSHKNRSFDGIRKYLENHFIEGIVFWMNNEPRCKIKRSDFGFSWPVYLE